MKSSLLRATAVSVGLALAIAAATAASPSTPANPLRVGLVASQGQVDSFLGAVEVTITNTGDKTVRLPKWQLPSANGEGQLFAITRDGEAVQYTGRMVKWGTPNAADFAILRPGQTHRTIVDLSNAYDLSKPGQYVVTFAKPLQFASLSGGVALKTASGAAMLLQSAPMQLWKDSLVIASPAATGKAAGVPGSRFGDPQLPGSAPITSRHPSSTPMPGLEPNPRCIPGIRGVCTPPVQATLLNCSTARQDLVKEAIAAARVYSENAKGYLLSGGQGDRYTWWFGAYLADRNASARQNFAKIDTAMDQNAGQVSINCACEPGLEGSYAYVYPNDAYKIYVCNAFWAAGMTGTDSKAGTLIHEMSHFTIVADTNDWVYGQSGAHDLALNNPNRTSGNVAAGVLGNADSHEYFAENTPTRN